MPNRVEFRWAGAKVASASGSLGGAISTYAASGMTASGFDSVSGVSFVDANITDGEYTLNFDQSASTLQFGAGAAVDVSAGGRFSLLSGVNVYCVVDVVVSALPAADLAVTITLSKIDNLLFDDAPASASATEYVCMYVYALSAVTALSVGVTQPNGVGSLSIGLDPAGVGGTATTIADKTTVPTGVTFAVTDATVGDMTAGQSAAFWIKRVAGGSQAGADAAAALIANYT